MYPFPYFFARVFHRRVDVVELVFVQSHMLNMRNKTFCFAKQITDVYLKPSAILNWGELLGLAAANFGTHL